jgi:hypothetical protein
MAGDFRGVLFNEADGVTAVDVVTGKTNAWVVNAHNANAIALSDSMVFVGGYMQEVQESRFTYLAAFRRDTVPPLAASSLVTTPGDTDKRIDLSWAASPSKDVKDYLVYRTFTSGADTTGRQVAVSTETFYSDVAPAYGEWFYRVYARDDAHNRGPASNEDSAIAPEIVPPTPNVTTSIHQNPALSRRANVVVVSDSLLMQVPTVAIVRPPDTTETPVTMTIISGAPSAYQGDWSISESGLHTIRTSIVTAGGNAFEYERAFTATLLRPDSGGEARSPTGVATLRVPPGLLHEDVYVVAEETHRADELPGVRFGPALAFDGAAVIELAYDPALHDDPTKLFVARVENEIPVPMPSDVLPDRRVVRARIDRLGEFVLVYDPAYAGDNTLPLQFALHPNHPNPFTTDTKLRFDLPADGPVEVAIYDVEGRRVAVVKDGFERAGRHVLGWDGTNGRGSRVAAGVYFVRVTAAGDTRSSKIVRLR